MKLTSNDKALLRKMGFSDQDFAQIEEALQRRKTKYRLGSKPISREEAIVLLGRETFLSGISRSAFHYTAARKTPAGEVVYFDSCKLFE